MKIKKKEGKKNHRMSERDFVQYLHVVTYYIVGHLGAARDLYLKDPESIRRASRFLLQDIIPGFCHRGIILDGKHMRTTPDSERTFISFTEDKRIAQHFADLGPNGFGYGPYGMYAPEFVRQGRGAGYLAKHKPALSEVLFHHDLFKNPALRTPFEFIFDQINRLAKEGSLSRTFIHQKEVILFNEGQVFDLIPFQADGDYLEYAAEYWKKAEACPSCGEDATKCPCDD